MFDQYQSRLQVESDALQNQIADLQRQLSQLQAHEQAIGSVEQACVSALDQIRTAVRMINSIAPELSEEFKEAVSAEFTCRPLLNPPIDVKADEETIEPAPTYPDLYSTEIREEYDRVRWDITQEVKLDHLDGLINAIDRVIQSAAQRPANLSDLQNRVSQLPELPILSEMRHVADRVLAHYAPKVKKRGRKPKANSPAQLAA